MHRIISEMLDVFKQQREIDEKDADQCAKSRQSWNSMLIKLSSGNEYANVIEAMADELQGL